MRPTKDTNGCAGCCLKRFVGSEVTRLSAPSQRRAVLTSLIPVILKPSSDFCAGQERDVRLASINPSRLNLGRTAVQASQRSGPDVATILCPRHAADQDGCDPRTRRRIVDQTAIAKCTGAYVQRIAKICGTHNRIADPAEARASVSRDGSEPAPP